MTCCRYLSIAFRPDFPPAEANSELPKVEILAQHLSGKALLVYALVNFQRHLDHLGSNHEKIRDEFMNFDKLLMNHSNSYASLLLGQWIGALKWPTKLHVDDASARLCLHLLLLCAAETEKKEVAEVLRFLRPDLLHVEAGKGHPVAMKQLLENGPHVTPESIDEWTTFAATGDREGGLKLLLDLGADVDSKDTASRTQLSYAAGNGHEGRLKLLLNTGAADVNSKDAAGRTPISYAAGNGHEDNLRLLFQYGHDEADGVNSQDTAGRTPLLYASGNGHEDIVRLLLKNGADLDLKDKAGRTSLWYATANKHVTVVKLLQSHIRT